MKEREWIGISIVGVVDSSGTLLSFAIRNFYTSLGRGSSEMVGCAVDLNCSTFFVGFFFIRNHVRVKRHKILHQVSHTLKNTKNIRSNVKSLTTQNKQQE